MSYNPLESFEEGAQQRQVVTDDLNRILLENVLKELKKMNLHLSLITDTNIENTEVE